MFIRVLDCISSDHNPTLVVVAIVVALFSGFALFTILDHARARHGRTKIVWIFVAAFTAGAEFGRRTSSPCWVFSLLRL